MENIENLESAKSIAESDVKMCSIGNMHGFHDQEILQIFYRYLQFVCKLNKKSRTYGTSDRSVR